MPREMPLSELEEKYRKLSSLEKARTCWENEYHVSSKQVRDMSNINLCLLGYSGM